MSDAGSWASEEQRSQTLNRIVFMVARKPIREDAIVEWIQRVNVRWFSPPMDEHELAGQVIERVRKIECDGRRLAYLVPYHHEESVVLVECYKVMGTDIRWNELAQKVEIAPAGTAHHSWDWKRLAMAADLYKQQSDIKRLCFVEPRFQKNGKTIRKEQAPPVSLTKDAFLRSISAAAKRHSVNPLKHWLESLPAWDGKDRLDNLFQNCGFEILGQPEVARFAARNILLSLINRAIKPGCKADEMVILFGGQGIGKSSFWRYLVPNESLFTDDFAFDREAKTRAEILQGKWIAEVAELSGFGAREWGEVFSFLSRSTDRCRMAYDREATDFPRTAILGGSTNDEKHIPFVNDGHGSRRFISVHLGGKLGVTSFKMKDWFDENRNQLYAEAYHRWFEGEKAIVVGEIHKLLDETNRQRAIIAPMFQDCMAEILEMERVRAGISVKMVLEKVGLPQNPANYAKAVAALRLEGFVQGDVNGLPRQRREDGTRQRLWYHPSNDGVREYAQSPSEEDLQF